MSPLQQVFIVFTFVGPPLLWFVSRKVESPRFARGISWAFAIALFVSHVTAYLTKRAEDSAAIDELLPMHLCDWASIATIIALVGKRQTPFELAYFWGLAGTTQALFTPAIALGFDLRSIAFLVLHTAIPAGVLWMMFEFKERPQRGAWIRGALWSQVYLGVALIVNHFTGGNYGFLSHPPARASLLDYFPQDRVLYVLSLDAFALTVFFLFNLPWVILRWRRGTADA